MHLLLHARVEALVTSAVWYEILVLTELLVMYPARLDTALMVTLS